MVVDNSIITALQKCPVLSDFSIDEIEALAEYGKKKAYNKNQVVFPEDSEGKYFFLVQSGELVVQLKNREAKHLKAGALFGEVAIFDNQLRCGTVRALKRSNLIAFNRQVLFGENFLPPRLVIKIIKRLTCQIINYQSERFQRSSAKLIAEGEGQHIEFKESMSCKEKILETIAAFMNTDGGTLFIGVKDDREVIGLKVGSPKSIDKQMLYITNSINRRMGKKCTTLINICIDPLPDGKRIMRIDCDPSPKPIFLRKGKEDEFFYRRFGASNNRLKPSDMLPYIKNRFDWPW